jgi:3-oxoacyl-[acyl-carrier protein] reductase
MNLRGRVALITAGSRGLGAEIARQMAAQGADIAFTFLRDQPAADQFTGDLSGLGRKALAIQADAANFTKAQSVVEETLKQLGRLDILVCNAGIARSAPLVDMTEADWDTVANVSLKGAFNYIRAAAPVFVRQGYGKIICIGSINGLRGRAGTASYNAAKAGLVGLVKTAAIELGESGVNVNLVAPGFIETPAQANTPKHIRDLVLWECAVKHLGTPADIAPLVVFLASDGARHITGQVIKVDAGQYL